MDRSVSHPPKQGPPRRRVVIGLLGTTLDAGGGDDRWSRWRPTVSVCQHEDLLVDRFELLHSAKHASLARTIVGDIGTVSPETEVRLHAFETADPWDFEEVFGGLLDFARGYAFDLDAEDYYVHISTGTHVAQICLFLLTESRHLPARLLQTGPPAKRGKRAREAGVVQVIDLDLSRYDRLAMRFAAEHREGLDHLKAGIATKNAEFNRRMEELERVVIASTAPILLTGPTGAGKTQLARRIYDLKRQRGQVSGPFVELNCATLRGDAAMSALFGHRRGAFTGAVADRAGLLRAADGGVLFLDEIGELGPDEQAMLLRAIEERRFLPVGSDREERSDFQLIAGSNRDLRARVREGGFREDLLARIDLWTFELPGLAARREDVAPNLDYELELRTRQTGRKVTMNREARERFLAFAVSPAATWAGNFRDLNAAVVRMATLAKGGRIRREEVEGEIGRLESQWRAGAPGAGEPGADRVIAVLGPKRAAELDLFDRVQLEEVLRVCAASRSLSEAGRRLFQASLGRRTSRNDSDRLRKYLARFGIDGGAAVGSESGASG